VSNASYWMCLTHLAPITWMAGLLARSDASAFVKFAIVLGVTTIVTALTYHFFVRATAVGELLNGRRYPRSLPRLEPPPTVIA